jgi:hypothetical protein
MYDEDDDDGIAVPLLKIAMFGLLMIVAYTLYFMYISYSDKTNNNNNNNNNNEIIISHDTINNYFKPIVTPYKLDQNGETVFKIILKNNNKIEVWYVEPQ